METAQEFLQKKGFRKVHQLNRRYNLTIGELVQFLNEYAHKARMNGSDTSDKNGHSNSKIIDPDNKKDTQLSHPVNG